MNALKTITGAALLTLMIAASPAQADSADAIVEQMNVEEQFMKGIQPILPMMSDQMVAQLQAGGMTIVSRIEQDGKGGLPRFKQIIREEFTLAIETALPELSDEIADILRENMTNKELRKVEKFIKTDAGKKFFEMTNGGMQQRTQRFGERIGAQAGSTALSRALDRAQAEQF